MVVQMTPKNIIPLLFSADTMSKKVVQYAPLPQTVPSDDEDDIHQSQELGKSSAGRGSDAVEMRNISSSQSDQAVRYAMGKGRKRCMVLTIVVVCVVVAGMAGAVAFHILSSSFNAGRVHSINFSPYGDWMIFYNDSSEYESFPYFIYMVLYLCQFLESCLVAVYMHINIGYINIFFLLRALQHSKTRFGYSTLHKFVLFT